MFKSFADVEAHITGNGYKKTLALAGSHDPDALGSVVMARRKGIVNATLIGDIEETQKLLASMNEGLDHFRFVEAAPGRASADLACKMVADGEADMPMKGKMQTADFMRAVLDKGYGFIPDKGLLCQATVLDFAHQDRLVIISDCAVNVAPEYGDKLKILKAAVTLAHQLGFACPRVAVLAPVETINPAMPATIDAAMLSKANQRGQIAGCVVDGPLALDNAIDAEAAKAKGVGGDVAGRADVLIMPDLAAGNIFTKSLHYFAHLKQSGTITGANIPVVMTSRTDTTEDKYYSILISVMQSL